MIDTNYNSNSSTSSTTTEQFDITKVNQALSQNKTVFIDFTAKWCLTCQLNESTVINSKPVQEKLRNLKVVFLKADWTRQDPVITRLLRKFNRSGVPLYIIYPAGKPNEPIILPELITTEMVLEKLDQAGPSK